MRFRNMQERQEPVSENRAKAPGEIRGKWYGNKKQKHDRRRADMKENVEELVKEYEVEEIVLGFPKNMNNTIGERAEKSLQLKETLERRLGLPVVMWDERLTTVEANRTLMETGVRRENRGKYVDMIAAVFILQGYLDAKANPDTV